MKKRIPSIVMYVMNLVLFFVPWLTVGEKKCNLLQFVFKIFREGLDNLILGAGMPQEYVELYKAGIIINLVVFSIFLVVDVIYIILMIRGRESRLNLINVIVILGYVAFDTSGISLSIIQHFITNLFIHSHAD